MTDNAPAHSQFEVLTRDMLVADGVVNGNRLVILRLGPYSPMLNPIEGCWSVMKASMKKRLIEIKQEFLVRGDYDSFAAHRIALLKSTFDECSAVITRRLVWKEERHCFRACAAAESGEDMQLGN